MSATPQPLPQGTDTICMTLSSTCVGLAASAYQSLMTAPCVANDTILVYTSLSGAPSDRQLSLQRIQAT